MISTLASPTSITSIVLGSLSAKHITEILTFKNQKLPLMYVLNALNVYLHHSKGSKQLVTFSFVNYVVRYFEEHTTQYGMDY
ncbi:hypothetical protein QOT17_015679 [Balamuthia mandrillaris]